VGYGLAEPRLCARATETSEAAVTAAAAWRDAASSAVSSSTRDDSASTTLDVAARVEIESKA